MASLPLRPAARTSVVILTALVATLARPAPASACGGMVFPAHEERVGGMSDQELAVVFGAEETVLVASAGYDAVSAAEFAFLLPLASAPAEVRDGDSTLFLALDEYSAPRVAVFEDEDEPMGLCGSSDKAGGGDGLGDPMGDRGDVMVVDRGETATYEYVVIGGDTGTAIADWLTDAGYPLPADYAAALAPYVENEWFFFAAKVKPAADSGALAPIELHLPPAQPATFEIPLAIATHSMKPGAELRLTTYFIGGGPVLPQNYAAQAVDDDELVAISDTETNYAELEAAVLASDPEGAWVIDFSNPLYAGGLAEAYDEGTWAGRIDPMTNSRAWLEDFTARAGLDGLHLTRLRTALKPEQVRDLTLRAASGPPVDNLHSVTVDTDYTDACRIDRTGRLPQLLLLVPVLAWIRRKPRRR
ncbi:hypothetical protein SAMN02745121_02425 [Nannocystis exedens]|uniref:DUF2330 domain-containing protein n=1 Tax=Nannocystis exedens TaxID=54 RepID=A0A1I1WLN4_9BACT|nr:DUF2330 domain-containing protein [Nannocystis exedens]PCC67789.1 hypothetical protein NAEX_00797 [Nannocystis exedens]SFD95298.1 hypothetical protein SAMN02745121_02425 [Nannocystis exedens]